MNRTVRRTAWLALLGIVLAMACIAPATPPLESSSGEVAEVPAWVRDGKSPDFLPAEFFTGFGVTEINAATSRQYARDALVQPLRRVMDAWSDLPVPNVTALPDAISAWRGSLGLPPQVELPAEGVYEALRGRVLASLSGDDETLMPAVEYPLEWSDGFTFYTLAVLPRTALKRAWREQWETGKAHADSLCEALTPVACAPGETAPDFAAMQPAFALTEALLDAVHAEAGMNALAVLYPVGTGEAAAETPWEAAPLRTAAEAMLDAFVLLATRFAEARQAVPEPMRQSLIEIETPVRLSMPVGADWPWRAEVVQGAARLPAVSRTGADQTLASSLLPLRGDDAERVTVAWSLDTTTEPPIPAEIVALWPTVRATWQLPTRREARLAVRVEGTARLAGEVAVENPPWLLDGMRRQCAAVAEVMLPAWTLTPESSGRGWRGEIVFMLGVEAPVLRGSARSPFAVVSGRWRLRAPIGRRSEGPTDLAERPISLRLPLYDEATPEALAGILTERLPEELLDTEALREMNVVISHALWSR